MPKTEHVRLDEIIGYFDELEDPRAEINRKHPLVSVVVIAMMAVLAGASGPTAIAKWATCKAEFLAKVLSLPPSGRQSGSATSTPSRPRLFRRSGRRVGRRPGNRPSFRW